MSLNALYLRCDLLDLLLICCHEIHDHHYGARKMMVKHFEPLAGSGGAGSEQGTVGTDWERIFWPASFL